MAGLLVALAAIYLGAYGPRFWWRGGALLVVVMVAAGIGATIQAANDAREAGLGFGVTPASIALGLIGQAVFASSFYGLSALGMWSYRGLTQADSEPPLPE